jgi:thiol-disulfide isomerase/thioredoxin
MLNKIRPKLTPLVGAVAAAGLLVLLFKPDAGGTAMKAAADRGEISELAMPALDGREWKLSDHRGKVVLLNFWATWCPPCRAEVPALARISREYTGRVEVVGVSLDEGAREVRRFVTAYKVPYPILMPPPDDSLAAAVQSLPTTLLIDAGGRVARTYVGAEPERVFRRDIEQLLAERSL